MSESGLSQGSCFRRHATLPGAWWRPAVSSGGLHQVNCDRRHASLRGAWWRTTMSESGLSQVSCCRRHASLRGSWWRPTVSSGGLHQGSCFRRHTVLQGAWWRQTLPTEGLLQPHCCTQRVLQALQGRVIERYIRDTTASSLLHQRPWPKRASSTVFVGVPGVTVLSHYWTPNPLVRATRGYTQLELPS